MDNNNNDNNNNNIYVHHTQNIHALTLRRVLKHERSRNFTITLFYTVNPYTVTNYTISAYDGYHTYHILQAPGICENFVSTTVYDLTHVTL